MKKNIVWIIIGLVVVIGLIVIFTQNKSNQPTTEISEEMTPSPEEIVETTSSPEEIVETTPEN